MSSERCKKHERQTEFEKGIKRSKRACNKWGINYKENPYCVGISNNQAKEIYPCLKYIK